MFIFGCGKGTQPSRVNMLCGLLRSDGIVEQLMNQIEQIKVSFTECPECFAFNGFLKNCVGQKSTHEYERVKYPPHPEIQVALVSLHNGIKPERDIVTGLLFFCDKILQKDVEGSPTVYYQYVSSICEMAEEARNEGIRDIKQTGIVDHE